VRSFLRKIVHYYPFSTLGTIAAAAGIYLFIAFIRTANPLSLVFSAGFIVTVTALAVIGRLFAARVARAVVEWDSSQPLVADTLETGQFVNLEGVSLFPFFNLHFRLIGSLKVGRGAFI
jgi:hypothetical protein